MVGTGAGSDGEGQWQARRTRAGRDGSARTLGHWVSPSDREWTTRAAKANRPSLSDPIDQVVARDSLDTGLSEPPPDRIARTGGETHVRDHDLPDPDRAG